MEYQIAVMSHPIWHPIGQIFQDIASYPETWIWWNRAQVQGQRQPADLPKMKPLDGAVICPSGSCVVEYIRRAL